MVVTDITSRAHCMVDERVLLVTQAQVDIWMDVGCSAALYGGENTTDSPNVCVTNTTTVRPSRHREVL